MGAKRHSNYVDILMELAKHGLYDETKISTTAIAARIGLSQQSASRIMREMEKQGLVSRKVFADGQVVRIEEHGIELLNRRYLELGSIFSRKKHYINGILVSGVGEGKYYVGLKGYKKQFKEKLNFIPYAGTLNLKVDPKIGRVVNNLPEYIVIDGFSTKKRSFGGLRCAKAKIEHRGKQIVAAVIKPFRTVHGEDIIEVIAPDCLREKLRIKDGDKVRLVV